MVPHKGLLHWEYWLMLKTIFLPHSFPPGSITDYFKEYLLKYWDLFGFIYLLPWAIIGRDFTAYSCTSLPANLGKGLEEAGMGKVTYW